MVGSKFRRITESARNSEMPSRESIVEPNGNSEVTIDVVSDVSKASKIYLKCNLLTGN